MRYRFSEVPAPEPEWRGLSFEEASAVPLYCGLCDARVPWVGGGPFEHDCETGEFLPV